MILNKYNKLLFISSILLHLLINVISCYYLVLDKNANDKYENSNCGDLDENKNIVLPPCKNWYDIGERSRNLNIDYSNDFKSELIVYILNSKNERLIKFTNNSELTFGGIKNYCKVYFKIVDNELNEINDTRIELVGKPYYEHGADGFLTTNETLINNFNCKQNNENIIISIYNFNFNGVAGSIIDNTDKTSNFIYKRNIVFTNCIFNNTVSYESSWGQYFPIFKKSVTFNNCNFTYSGATLIDARFTDIEINSCNFYNIVISFIPLINIGINSNLKLNSCNIYNSFINGLIQTNDNNHEIIFNNVSIYNNTIQFLILTDNELDYKPYNNFKIMFLHVNFKNNLIIDGYGQNKTNTYSNYNSLFDLTLYTITYSESFLIDKNYDNTTIVLNNSIFNNNKLYKSGVSINFLKIDSYSNIIILNSSIGDEFIFGINARNPKILTINNSNINSYNPIIGTNIKVSLNNNIFKTNIDQSLPIYNKSNIININTSTYNNYNEIQYNLNRQKKKRFIVIPIVLIIVLIVSISLIFIIQYIKQYFANKRLSNNNNNNNNINDDEANGESNTYSYLN